MASRPQTPARGQQKNKPAPQPARKPAPAAPQRQTQPARPAPAAPQRPAAQAAPQRPAAQAAPPQRPAPERQNGAVAVRRTAGAMSTEFARAASEHADARGLSQAQEDNLVPLAYILQKLSPQCEPKKAEYIEGARPGQIWLKQTGIVEADKGEQHDGIIVQPCHFSKWIMEWIPRDAGGGLVGRFQMEIGETAEQALARHGKEYDKVDDPRNPNKRPRLVTPDGHELMEVREHVCRVFVDGDPDRALPYVLPMSGTNHAVSRGWMLMMNSKSLNGNRLNSYTSLYRLRTKWNENEQGDWFNYVVDDLGTLDVAAGVVEGLDWQRELELGKALADAFGTGEKQTDVADYDTAGTGTVQSGDDGGEYVPHGGDDANGDAGDQVPI